MTEKEGSDYFYVCSLIEYTACQTKNRRRVITKALAERELKSRVSDEIIEQYKIPAGDFDTITECKYTVPGFMDIRKLYSIMIEDCAVPGREMEELLKIFDSFISDEISEFQTELYYQNPDYLEWSYREGHLLD